MLAGAALIVPPAFADGASAQAKGPLPPHDRKAAKAEWARIVAMFDQSDLQAFLAYGPPGVIAYASGAGSETRKLTPEQIPDFLIEQSTSGGRKDNGPTRIDSFARMKNVPELVVYSSSLTRSAFREEFCDVHLDCRPEGYGPLLEFWRIYFVGPRIRLLEQMMVIS